MHEISYQNALLYSRANIINYKPKKDNDLPFDESKDACEVGRFDDFEDEEVVRV